MLRIIGYAGPWAVPLALLTVALGVLVVRAALRPAKGPVAEAERAASRSAILFWGFVSAVLGFLGQCAGLYRAITFVVTAPELSPEVVADGFARSFVPTLWGGGLLLVAGLAWLLLRKPGQGRAAVALVLAVAVAAVTACKAPSARGPDEITQGVWVGGGGPDPWSDGGPDQFLFELRGTAPDSLAGVVHVMSGGKMTSEVTITRASYRAPELEMFMGPTNATYKGRVDLAGGRIEGGLSFGGTPGPRMDLRWTDPTDLPGFRGTAGGEPWTYREPEAGDDGWEVASAAEAGLDEAALDSLVNAVARGDGGLIHSLLVVRGGKLVVDAYFHGYTADDLHRLASATKSVSSLLVGAALDRGLIGSFDEPLLEFFPDAAPSAGEGWSQETLNHLLTMSMGLDWTPAEADTAHGTGEAFFRRVLARRVAHTPGTRWAYVNADVNLLAGVIHHATGEHAEVFAREVLFGPLGIRTWDWKYGQQDGYALMDGSLRLRPRDLAKIGTLVAQGGRWQGQQVIREATIRELTRPHMQTSGGAPLSGYGDLWWLGELPTSKGVEPIVAAIGRGSQFVVIFPRLDMVVVTTAGNEDNGQDVGGVLARYLPSLM